MASISPEFTASIAIGIPSLLVAILTWLETRRRRLRLGGSNDIELGLSRANHQRRAPISLGQPLIPLPLVAVHFERRCSLILSGRVCILWPRKYCRVRHNYTAASIQEPVQSRRLSNRALRLQLHIPQRRLHRIMRSGGKSTASRGQRRA